MGKNDSKEQRINTNSFKNMEFAGEPETMTNLKVPKTDRNPLRKSYKLQNYGQNVQRHEHTHKPS